MSPLPSLPTYDPQPDNRAAEVARDRTAYHLTRDFGDLPFPREIPLDQELTPRYLMLGAKWEAKSYSNIAAVQARALYDEPDGGVDRWWSRFKQGVSDSINRRLWGPRRDVRLPHWTARTPIEVAEYEMAFPCVRKPESLRRWRKDSWFAMQRLAGTNPVLIESVTEIPDKMGRGEDRDRLVARVSEAALAERRVFVVDYPMLKDIEAGTGYGFRKWLCAPVALFELTEDRRQLMPVAIQCAQTPGPDNPVFFPEDGTSWLMARTVLQCSDSNYHGVVEHGTLCHMMMGIVDVCMHRSMAPQHPLRILLEPNLDLSLKIDDLTKDLFLPGGRTPVIQSVSEQGTIDLSRWGYRTFDWNERAAPRTFERRGVLEKDVLPDYPYRDDILPHWVAVREYVNKYVRLYYSADADVGRDYELQTFVRLMQDRSVGGVKGIGVDGEIQTLDALVDFIAQAIWRATSYHAVINYSVYDAMGIMPNMPMAQYAPPPRHREHEWMDFLAMLPPRMEMYRQFDDVFVVGSLRYNRLGEYPLNYFADRRVRPIVDSFQQDLQQIEFDIRERNRWDRRAPYEILLPSNVTASIHI